MMHVYTEFFKVKTQGKGTYEITHHIRKLPQKSGLKEGQLTVFVQHTSCSLVLMENADPSARDDLHAFIEQLVPETTPYFTHTYEGSDDMPSHIRMVLTGGSEVIPFFNSSLALGTWQGVFLFEHRQAPHTRNIVVSILGCN